MIHYGHHKPENDTLEHRSMTTTLTLTGDTITPEMPLTDAQVNHMRRLLAWMRGEYMLDEDMQRGLIRGVSMCVEHGIATPEKASELVQERVDQVNRVPAYVRQAVKMLTKALRDHERKAGIVEVAP